MCQRGLRAALIAACALVELQLLSFTSTTSYVTAQEPLLADYDCQTVAPIEFNPRFDVDSDPDSDEARAEERDMFDTLGIDPDMLE